MIDRIWKSLNDDRPVDFIASLTEEMRRSPCEIHVGTDSQQIKMKTEFVTVVVVVRPGKGGRVFYTREKVPRIKALRERLTREVWMSTELSMELTASPDIGSSIVGSNDITIHIDANPDPKYKSSAYVQELAGMCVGQGFRMLLKPDSWAAAHAADHAVKNKMKLHRRERAA